VKEGATSPSEITRKLREVEYITSRRSWPEDGTAHLFNGQKGGRVPAQDKITSSGLCWAPGVISWRTHSARRACRQGCCCLSFGRLFI